MVAHMRNRFSFYMFMTVSLCLSAFLLKNAAAQSAESVADNYTLALGEHRLICQAG